jgi:hypothetical protein
MDKVLHIFNSFEEAQKYDDQEIAQMSCNERLELALRIMQPFYESTKRFERILRIADLSSGGIPDRW